jgi:hypothetical protein
VYFVDAAWADMHVSMWHARGEANALHREMFGAEMGVTSGRRPPTPGGSSLHGDGKAMDIRTKHLTQAQEAEFARKLQERLGEDFEVIIEGEFAPNEKYRNRPRHVHVEYQPKGRHAP